MRGFPLWEYFILARLALGQDCSKNSSAAAVAVAAAPLSILAKYKRYTKEVASVKLNCSQEQNNTVQSDSWKYNNELPMNGGDMGGIFGYNNLESNYASFDDKTELDKCKNSTCVMNSDDIRMGLGYPNEENRDN